MSGAPPAPGSRTDGCAYGSDHGGVDVAEAIELGGAEEAHGDPAALQPVAEELRHRDRRQRRRAQLAVADRQRQHGGPRADRARLVDQRDPRRVREPREVARRRRLPDPDEADVVVAHGARCRDGQDLVGGVGCSVMPTRRPRRRTPPVRRMTCSSIHAVNVARSREIASQALVEGVVARVVAEGVRGKRAARHDRDRRDRPARQDAGVRDGAVEACRRPPRR